MTIQRLAVVTGSGKKRVGATVAKHLAKHGYGIAVHYRSSANEAKTTVQELRQLGVEAEAFQADLAQEAEVKAFAEAVQARFGRVDVLVNCAAVWNSKVLEDVRAVDVLEHFQTNTLGTFLTCQHFGLQMVQQESGGVIINIGDWAEVRPYLGYAAYFPSKGGVTALTRSMAVELAARNPNIRVNAILPGPVMLPPDLDEVEREEAVAGTLLQREGSPDNVAQAVLALIENDYITGVCLPVDGGRTLQG